MALFNFVIGGKKDDKDKKAAEAFARWYQDMLSQGEYQRGVTTPLLQGQGVLPGGEALTGGIPVTTPVDPNSAGAREAITYGRGLPPPPPEVAGSQLYSNMAYQVYLQALQNDPAIQEQLMQRKMREEEIKRRGGAFEGLAKQRTIGTQNIGPGIRGKVDFTAPQLQESYATGRGMATESQERAKEPFKEKAQQRKIQLKQTPTYKQLTGGGGGGTTKAPQEQQAFSSVTSGDIGRMEKILMQKGEFKDIDPQTGRPVLNAQGMQVLQSAGNKLAGMKKKNLLKATKEALNDYRKESDKAPEEFMKFMNSGPAQQKAKEVAPSSAPQTQGTDPVMQKVNAARAKGIPDSEIRKALVKDGINPKKYGL